jgi:MoxR-like ATPase
MAKKKKAPVVFGSPGTGKTSFIRRFARENGIKIVTMSVGDMMPSDLCGVLVVGKPRKSPRKKKGR